MKITAYIRGNMSRPQFSKKYGIPVRTLEDWDAGKNNPPEYVINLLARAVYEDQAKEIVSFAVFNCGKYDEAILLTTTNILEAVRACGQGDDKNYHDELWVCTLDSEEDSFVQFERIEWETID